MVPQPGDALLNGQYGIGRLPGHCGNVKLPSQGLIQVFPVQVVAVAWIRAGAPVTHHFERPAPVPGWQSVRPDERGWGHVSSS